MGKYTMPIIITLSISFTLVVAGIIALIMTGHDPQTFLSDVITLVGVLPSIGVVGWVSARSANNADTAVKNTNGNLGRLQAQNQALLSVITPAQVDQANSLLSKTIHTANVTVQDAGTNPNNPTIPNAN